MEIKGYFVIDGSHLFASIETIWREKPEFKGKKLNIGKLSHELVYIWENNIDTAVRITYYFKENDKRLDTMLIIPESNKPGEKDHWQIVECGKNVDAIPEEELQKIPSKYRDHFRRSEKGLDIKLTCDSLTLVASNKASSIVFLVNDRDYIPLFEAIQQMGGNVYITALDSSQSIQKKLTDLSDKYLALDDYLKVIFGLQ